MNEHYVSGSDKPLVSPCHHPTICIPDSTGNPGSLVREQEGNNGGDILGHTNPA